MSTVRNPKHNPPGPRPFLDPLGILLGSPGAHDAAPAVFMRGPKLAFWPPKGPIYLVIMPKIDQIYL